MGMKGSISLLIIGWAQDVQFDKICNRLIGSTKRAANFLHNRIGTDHGLAKEHINHPPGRRVLTLTRIG